MARIFKVGSVKIAEDPSMQDLTNEEVRAALKTQYPEVAEAAIREKTEGETTFVEFLPRPGRKG